MPGTSPHSAPWLDALSLPELNRAIVRRAMCDIGICEDPPGSNRSERIDEMNRRAGAPVGSYWCASFAFCAFEDAGARTPAVGKAPSVEEWRIWANLNGTFVSADQIPEPGYLVLYNYSPDPVKRADHCGIVCRVEPGRFATEGNASGAAYSRNGELVAYKGIISSGVLGWIRPLPRV